MNPGPSEERAQLQALEAQIGPAAVDRLLAIFDGQLAGFQQDAAAAAPAALTDMAHSIKGVAGSLGFARLSEHARELEAAAPGRPPPALLAATLQRVQAARDSIRARAPAQ